MKANNSFKLSSMFGVLPFSSNRHEKKEDNIIQMVGNCFVEINTPNLDNIDQMVLFECIKDFQSKNHWDSFVDNDIAKDVRNQYLNDNVKKIHNKYLSIVENKKKNSSVSSLTDTDIQKAKQEAIDEVLKPYLYFGESLNECYTKEFNVYDMLKNNGLSSSSWGKFSVLDSMQKLSSIVMTWYVPTDVMEKEIQAIKKGKLFYEFQPLLIEYFNQNKKRFDVHIRTFLHSASLTEEQHKVKVSINKGFLDLASRGKEVDLIKYKGLESNMSKNILIRLSVMKKPRLHVETLYEMLLLKKTTVKRSKKSNLKDVLEDLVEIGFLKSYTFDKDFVDLKYNLSSSVVKP